MAYEALHGRTYAFALSVARALKPLLGDPLGRVLAGQLLRSAWSVAANYRTTRHARSGRDFVSKMSIVAEEAEESAMWLEGLRDLQLLEPDVADPLRHEAGELTAIAVASIRTVRRRAKEIRG